MGWSAVRDAAGTDERRGARDPRPDHAPDRTPAREGLGGRRCRRGRGADVLAQVQAEAASTWRSPMDATTTVRGADRLRGWCEGFSLHAGVVIAEHDRDALERLCRYGALPAFALERLVLVRWAPQRHRHRHRPCAREHAAHLARPVQRTGDVRAGTLPTPSRARVGRSFVEVQPRPDGVWPGLYRRETAYA